MSRDPVVSRFDGFREKYQVKRWTATFACVATMSCGGSRGAPSVDSPSGAAEGVYEFSANLPAYEPGKTLHIQGTLTIIGDSLIVQSPNGCTAELGRTQYFPRGMPYVPGAKGWYNCGGTWLSFRARDPVKSAIWYASVPVAKQRNACVEYVRRETRQVCVRYRPETYYEHQTRSGGIQVKRVS